MEVIDANNIESIFTSKSVKKLYSLHKNLVNPAYPEMNYFGINFSNGKVSSVKFYFAFFHRLDIADIAKFLPVTSDFLKYYSLWDESATRNIEHTGCTFELKIKPGKEPTYGFHFRLKPIEESYNVIGYPKLVPFNMLEVNTRPGINFEYCGNETVIKKYYYFNSPQHKEYFANRFNLPHVKNIHLLEYTESAHFSKANFWRFDYTDENRNRPTMFHETDLEIINLFRKKYNLINVSEGYYENEDTVATYFFNTLNNEGFTPFDHPENFQIDTLKLFIQ